MVLNQLLKHTRLQVRFSANMVALVGGMPQSLPLKDCLRHFLDFRWGVCVCGIDGVVLKIGCE